MILPVKVRIYQGTHFGGKISRYFFIFLKLISLFSCHILSNSSIVIHFYQPAIGRSIVASLCSLPLSNGRKASLPACPAVALNGSVALGAAGVFDPESGRPRCTRTNQWSASGLRGKRLPISAQRVPAGCNEHSAQGK